MEFCVGLIVLVVLLLVGLYFLMYFIRRLAHTLGRGSQRDPSAGEDVSLDSEPSGAGDARTED